MTTFAVACWRLPVKSGATWGWGTSLLAIPGTTSVVMSLPSGGPRSPWCIVDLVSGEILRGAGMPGDLRAILFDSAHQAADPRPWVLATFGLGRLHLGPRPAVTDVVRKGIGKYRTTLLDLGPDVFGVGSGAVLCAAHNLVALHVEDPPNDGLHAVQWWHKPTR